MCGAGPSNCLGGGASFHWVICINALHHFTDKLAFLAEARRVLRPGGALMTVGLDPHTGLDRWHIYEYFQGTLEIDRGRYPSSDQIRAWMTSLGFSRCRTIEVQRIPFRVAAREAFKRGFLDRTATSQLSVLTNDEYERGIQRIEDDLEAAEARGESLYLTADLRLYASYASVESKAVRCDTFTDRDNLPFAEIGA